MKQKRNRREAEEEQVSPDLSLDSVCRLADLFQRLWS